MNAPKPKSDDAAVIGAGRGSENLARLTTAIARLLEAGPANRVAGQLNRQWLGREANIDPQCLKRSRNPKCADAFEAYDTADRARWSGGLEARRLDAERKAVTREADDRNENLILELRAENARLRSELDGFRALRSLLAETGRVP